MFEDGGLADAASRMSVGSSVIGIDISGLALPGGDQLERLADGSVAPAVLTAHLDSLNLAELRTDHDVLEVAAARERLIAAHTAAQMDAMVEFARRPDVLGADEDLALASRLDVGKNARSNADDELAARLTWSRNAAAGRLAVALDVATRLPHAGAALRAGRIDAAKVRVLCEELVGVDDDVAAAVEERVIEKAASQNLSRLRQSCKRAVLAIDPDQSQQRCERARRQRQVTRRPEPDGMASLWALLPAETASIVDAVITTAARAMNEPGDDRTMDAKRADAFAAPFLNAFNTGVLDGFTPIRLTEHHGKPLNLNVTVPASVLLGLSNAPGYLEGYGPLPADTVRAMATNATWRRLLTDPADGSLKEVGTTTYKPGVVLARQVELRDTTCRFPGCNWPARSCDLDHTIPFPRGSTTEGNLAGLCRRHHRFKHHDRDQSEHPDCDDRYRDLYSSRPPGTSPRLEQPTPGVLVWRMPTGHEHVVTPPALTPIEDDPLAHARYRFIETRPGIYQLAS